MDQPVYLTRLLRQKVLLIIGLIVSIAAGLLAGFTIQNGEVIPRADRVYTASSTVLLSSPQPDYFQVEIPSVTQALPQTAEGEQSQELIVTESVPIDLAANAVILAYLASSDAIEQVVADEMGGLSDDEGITAVSRTTQPTGDETFPGRLTLPLLSVGATALSPARAEALAAAATDAFAAMVVEQQDAAGVAEDIRLTTDVLNEPVADEGEGSNPAIPVVVVAVGVFLLFIGAALIIESIRDRRRGRRGDESAEADAADDDRPEPEDHATVDSEFEELVGASSADTSPATRRRHARAHRPGDADADQDVPVGAGDPTRG
ncbi:hypothetical protein [Microbacterium allomyrinae]|uniref:Capsular polysaccharide biosynthesis protein n=1 Tax=Microbacterium allomyrinae TaxID=2830666 RepID=A0A9X1LYM9_9MICO|nr:hypothetical protein [Microbacterium allomyrinae]MCC2034028.1 hypothetical protein [Microbacterium allomyrinae]